MDAGSTVLRLPLPRGADPESDLRWFPDIPADSDHMTTDHMISPVTQQSLYVTTTEWRVKVCCAAR